MPSENGNIVCEIVEPWEADQLIDFLMDNYIAGEPLTLDVSERDWKPYVVELVKTEVDKRLSIKAIDKSKGNKWVGASLNGRYSRDYKPPLKYMDEITTLLVEIYDRMDIFNRHKDANSVMEIMLLAVSSEATRQGVGKKLVARSLERMHEERIPMSFSFCTNKYTGQIMQQFGFEAADCVKYDEYLKNGKQVFNPDPPHTELVTYFKRIKV